MSSFYEILAGLLIQGVAIFLVIKHVGRHWLAYNGVLFLFEAIMFHGVTEIVQLIAPGRNPYRDLFPMDSLGIWLIAVSVAILLFTVSFLAAAKLLTSAQKKVHLLHQSTLKNVLFNWQALTFIVIPAYLITISGKTADEMGYWTSGLIDQFLIIGIGLLAFQYLHLRQGRGLIPALIVLSFGVALIGSRTMVMMITLILLSSLRRYGLIIKRKQLAAGILMVVVMMLAISSARSVVGREGMLGTYKERLTGLQQGTLTMIDGNSDQPTMLEDYIYRFDGNSFGTMLLSRREQGFEGTGLMPLWYNLKLTIPRFLFPGKLEQGLELNEETYLVHHYHLPVNIDYAPMLFGILYGYSGMFSLLLGAVLMGMLYGLIDRWHLKTKHPFFPLAAQMSLGMCALVMEQGVIIYYILFRGLVILWLAEFLAEKFTVMIKVTRREKGST